MKTATLQDAIDAGACYLNEPGGKEKLAKLFGRRKALTVKQIAALKIPDTDKVWALTRLHFLDTKEKSVRFAIFCAEQCLSNFEKWNTNDKRPREAIEAAKNWLVNPTDSAYSAAYSAADSAADSAARSAVRSAAYSARSAVRSAAYSTTDSTADSTAYSAADSAADSAAYSAYSAAYSAADSVADSAADSTAYSAARSAAYSAAYSTARSAQLKFLVKLLAEVKS